MKYIVSFFFLYTALFANSIHIDANTTDRNILQNISYFLDKGSQKTPEKIFSLESTLLSKSENSFLNMGYVFADTLWIKFTLTNDDAKKTVKYLVFDSPNIDILNLYYYEGGKLLEIKNGIFHREHFEKELAFSFPLTLHSHQEQTYLVQVRAMTHSLHFSAYIKSYTKFKDDEMMHQIGLSIFFAILFVIVFYNSMIYLYTQEKIYLYYAFFVGTIFLHHFSLRGMIAYLLPPDLIVDQAYMPPYYMAAVMFGVVLFTSSFLHLQRYKKIFFALKLLLVYVIILLMFNSQEHYLLNYLTPVAVVEVLYLEAIGAYLYLYKKEKYAKYFFYIWSVSLFGILLTIFYYEGLYAEPIPFLMEITFASETLLFSVVLSRYIKDLQVEKLKKENLLLEQSKMASMGSMLQNIAHQWRQPLAEINAIVMKIDADAYEKKLTPKSLEADLYSIERLTSHLSQTIESFNSYAQETKKVQKSSFEEAVQNSLQIMGSLLQDVSLKVDVHKSFSQEFNLNEITQVVLVILNNAVAALEQKKVEHKKITIVIRQESGKSILSIEDNAGGIEEKHLSRVFEPYFTTKFESQGVGIGLYMAKTIIASYRGDLKVSNTNNGAKFTILL